MSHTAKQQLMVAVLRVAQDSLTSSQARAVILHFVEGWTEERISSTYSVSRAAVSMCLWGQGAGRVPFDLDANGQPKAPTLGEMLKRARNKTIVGGGAVSRFSSAIADDPIIQAIIKEHTTSTHQAGTRANVGDWFAGCRPDLFGPLAVLLILSDLVDNEGKATMTALSNACHPALAAAAIPPLKTWGFIDSNGITLQLLKTPLGEFIPTPDAIHYGDDVTNPEDQFIAAIDGTL